MSKETIQELIRRHVIDNSGQWNHEADEAWILAGQGQFKITREEFNSAADRLRGKPDWSMLPAVAEWLAQDRCGTWKPMRGRKPTIEEGSYWITDQHYQPQPRGTVIGDWRNTLEKRPEHIGDANEKVEPAPAKPWFEAGELPPVGVKVEAIIELKYEECEVIAYFEDMVWLSVGDSKRHPVRMIEACKFKPIKTDKEKAIEAAMKIHMPFDSDEEGFGALYDAGLLRLPDNKKPD